MQKIKTSTRNGIIIFLVFGIVMLSTLAYFWDSEFCPNNGATGLSWDENKKTYYYSGDCIGYRWIENKTAVNMWTINNTRVVGH